MRVKYWNYDLDLFEVWWDVLRILCFNLLVNRFYMVYVLLSWNLLSLFMVGLNLFEY